MADISVTATSVTTTSGFVRHGTSGATLTQGMPVYLDAATGTIKACTTASEAAAACVGITLNAASSGQPVSYLTEGNLTFNAVLTKGTTYAVSDNAGGIRPVADNGSGDYITLLGVASSTSVLALSIKATGATF
jgi:hypothetical protein